MKRSMIAGVLAMGLMFSTQAMAKDVDAIDLFVGNFVGVGTIDMQKLAANEMLNTAIKNNSTGDMQEILKDLEELGIDYKKDVKLVAVASDEKGHVCAAADANKSLKEAWGKYAAKKKDKITKTEDYNGVTIYTESAQTSALISDTRILACDNKLDIKLIIDNAKSSSPKTLKSRDGAIYKAYTATSKSADIRVGAKMTKTMREKYGKYALEDGAGKSIGLGDAESASLSLDLSSGLNLTLVAKAKSAEVASTGAAILTAQVGALLSDPSLEQLQLGFLNKAVKFSSDKANLKGSVKLTNEQIATLAALFGTAAQAGGSKAKTGGAKAKK